MISGGSAEVLGRPDKEKYLLLSCLFPTQGQLPQTKMGSEL